MKVLRALAERVSSVFDYVGLTSFSLRGAVLLVGFSLALVSWRPQIAMQLDNKLFQMGTWLVDAPVGARGLVIIQVPPEKMDTWQSDIHQAGELSLLLANILDTSNSLVGLVLESDFNTREGSADKLLAELAETATSNNDALVEAKNLAQRKALLLDWMDDERVIVGVVEQRFTNVSPWSSDWGMLDTLPDKIKRWLWPMEQRAEYVELNATHIAHYPIDSGMQTQHFLFSETGSGGAIPNFLLAYLRAEQRLAGAGQSESIWHKDKGIALGTIKIPTSPTGEIRPFYGATQRMIPGQETISLAEAMARGTFPPRVYISSENSAVAKKLAQTTLSIAEGKMAHSPWWSIGLEKCLSVLFTLYAVLLIPRLSGGTGFVLTVLIIFLVLVGQVGAEATRKIWCPLATQILWLGCAHILMVRWALRRREWLGLQSRADEACVSQSRSLLEQGDLDGAKTILAQCSTGVAVLSSLYDVANGYSSKRQYRNAIAVLKLIKVRQKNYRDVSDKIEALRSMANTGEVNVPPPKGKLNADNTVLLSDMPQIEKPVLGRYEIREELGRGAMGTVYLAFDPKISRQVAIKTLNYSRFQGPQLEDIKARFFREAEAAGRLNHPNIVSVFDVGEEHDLAFIAMDFAEGKPLNAFATEATLLPVFEVYRIICDAALALEYAHTNQVVHRDVKPGNIMYSASPYQMKVSDFGIARLIDNSNTRTGEILGSPLYMAPEQLQGKKVTPQADIFSLGVTFYQLLTAKFPFEGDSLASLSYEIIHGKHKSIRGVRKDLPSSAARIVNQALQKEIGDRYASAAEMAVVLKKAIKREFANEAKRAGYV